MWVFQGEQERRAGCAENRDPAGTGDSFRRPQGALRGSRWRGKDIRWDVEAPGGWSLSVQGTWCLSPVGRRLWPERQPREAPAVPVW